MKCDVKSIIQELEQDYTIRPYLTALEYLPAQEAKLADYPSWLNPGLINRLKEDGIARLYSHQVSALNAIQEGAECGGGYPYRFR